MLAVRRARALFAGSLLAAIGCGTITPYPDRAVDPRRAAPPTPAQPPGWLTKGATPLPTTTTAAASAALSLPPPDNLTFEHVQPASGLAAPRIEEERSAANHPVAEPMPPISPVAAPAVVPAVTPVIDEPNWKPAGGFRAP
jgi:hypothetical protein